MRLEKTIVKAEEKGISNGEKRHRPTSRVEKRRVEEAPVRVVDEEGEEVPRGWVHTQAGESGEGNEEGGQLLDAPGGSIFINKPYRWERSSRTHQASGAASLTVVSLSMSGKVEACSENLPIFKQLHINKFLFGELAIGSRQDDGDEAKGEEVDAGDHEETPLKFVSVVRTKQGGRRLFKPDVHLEVKKIEISLFQQRCP